MRTPRSDDRGFTLIELLVAITLMAISFGAVFGGLGLYFKIQSTQRANATIDTEIRSYAERILERPYDGDCSADYSAATPPAAALGLTATVTVTYWDGNLPAGFDSTCTTDRGLQQITITLTATRGESGTLQIGKSR